MASSTSCRIAVRHVGWLFFSALHFSYCRFPRSDRKLTGLRALYYRYLYELGALPRKPRRPSYAVRQDAYKLDQRIRQMEFLSKNNIDTLAQLETYRQAKLGEIVQLTAERKSLYKTNPDSPRIQQVNTALKQLCQEERLCRKIAEHSLEWRRICGNPGCC